jgi:hypothetical protein
LTGRGAIKPNAFNKGAMNMGEFDESNSEWNKDALDSFDIHLVMNDIKTNIHNIRYIHTKSI